MDREEILKANKIAEENTGVDVDPNIYPRLVTPNNVPIGFKVINRPAPEEPDKPTFYETAGATFQQFNLPYRVGKKISEIPQSIRNARTIREEGYNPIEEGVLDGVDEAYWNQVLQATSRAEANLIKANISEELENKDIMARSGTLATFTSTMGAVLLDPTTLIPLSQTVKYASVSKGIIQNSIQAGKTLGPVIAAQNAALVASKETDDISNWAYDTLTETFVASAFGGLLGGFASKSGKAELKGAKAYFDAVKDDVDIKIKLGANGENEGLKAVARADSSVGAMAVEDIQAMLDAGQVSFRNNKFANNALTKWGSPLIKGLVSPFETIRRTYGELFPNPFELAGGKAAAITNHDMYSFVKLWQSTNEHANIFENSKWLEYIGQQGFAGSVRGEIGAYAGKWISKEEFSELVAKAYRRGGKSDIPQVAEAAALRKKEVYDPLLIELKKRYPNFKEHEFTNIESYLNRIYDKNKIQANPDLFIADVERYINGVNDSIVAKKLPIEDAIKKGNKELAAKLQAQLDKEIEERLLPLDMLESGQKIELNPPDAVEETITLYRGVSSKRSPAGTSDTIASSLFYSPNKSVAETYAGVEGKIIENEVTFNKLLKSKNWQEAKEKLGLKKNNSMEDLINIAREKGYDGLSFKGAHGIEYIYIPTKAPKSKLRNVLSKEQIRSIAEGVRNNIMQLNEEQVLGQVFDTFMSGGNNFLESRTLLWNDELAEKWLLNRMDVLSGLYVDQVSKRLYLEDFFKQYGGDFKTGKNNLIKNLLEERKIKEAEILKKEPSVEREKELKKLGKEFKDAERQIEDAIKLFMGNYTDRTTTAYRVTDGIKKFSVATMLGNLPILQLTEFFSPLFRFTFNEYIMDGLVPSLKKMQNIASKRAGGDVSYMRGSYADMGLGVNRYLGNRTQALSGYGAQYQPKTLAERYVSNLASMSQNVSLANMIMDAQEVMVSGMSESSLIRTLKRYQNGEKLTQLEINKLDRARLNPKEWSDRVLQQYQKHGQDVEGAFNPNFHLWEDGDAARIFKLSVEKEVRQVLLAPGPLDMPLAFKDPLMSLLTQFTSYIFTATNNFTIPLLTTPDAQKMIGALLMMGAGALVDPLRQLAKGEDVDLSPKALTNAALNNSGVFGWQYDGLMRINSALDLPPLQFLQSDRFKSKALTLGPASGLYTSASNVLDALAHNEMNLVDARRAVRLLVPFSGTWYLRQSVDKLLKSLNLPKNRQEAREENL